MRSFREIETRWPAIPTDLAQQLSVIDTAKGRQQAFSRQHPAALETLRQTAVIQSVEASNAIEGIVAPHARIAQLVEHRIEPKDRPEAEIAGYRDVLATIHASALDIPVKPSVIEQFHGTLLSYTGVPGGTFKGVDNTVTETLPDGSERIRFNPVGWFETPDAIRELCEGFVQERDRGSYHPLILVGSFVLDFLVIHPFRDGNGRMSRLLTLLLLYQSGFEVGRFISLERLIGESRAGYYDALEGSTTGWHSDKHDLAPWLSYFFGVLIKAYEELETKAQTSVGRGQKQALIRGFVRANVSDRFTVAGVRVAVPTASDAYIREVLRAMKAEGILTQENSGPAAEWRRGTNSP